jgi:distribution and morphology protein 31
VDHLQAATGNADGPISWITSGKFDAVVDFKLPHSEPSEDFDINEIVAQIAANISTITTKDHLPGQRVLTKPALTAPQEEGITDHTDRDTAEPRLNVMVDIDLRFRDVKAAVPLFTSELSRVNNALIRPIVAFIK